MSKRSDAVDSQRLSNLAVCAMRSESYECAESLLRRSLSIEIQNGHLVNQAADWGSLGVVLGLKGETNAAVGSLFRAYRLHSHVGDMVGAAVDLINMTEVLESTGLHSLIQLCLRLAVRRLEQGHFWEYAAIVRRRLAVEIAVDRASTRNPLLN